METRFKSGRRDNTCMNYRDNSLSHFGVVGMRWGVRKASGGRAKSYSEDYRNSRKLKAKGTKNLSTKELQELTTRLQLEKNYSDLSPNAYRKGMKFIKEITLAGTTVAGLYALTKSPLAQNVVSKIKKVMAKGG